MKAHLFVVATLISAQLSAAEAIEGFWKTIDDETGKPKSIVEIYEKDGKFAGKIVKLFREPTEDQNPKCDKCSGARKDQQVLGMEIMTDLKKDSDVKFSGGDILDPNNGKTYSCKVQVIEEGKKLKMRGFIGFSLLGRTQIWEKSEKP